MNQDYLKNYNAAQQGRFSGPSSESPLSPGLSQKEKDLVRARVRKSLELQHTKAKIDQEEAQYKASWSGQSGFERGGAPATVLNTGAKVWSEMARLTGAAASAPANTYSVVREHGVPEDAREAYGRYQNDEATEADMAALNRREVIDSIEGRRTGRQGTDSYGRGNIDIRTGGKREQVQEYERPKDLHPYTNLQNLEAAERASDVGEAITDEFDLKRIVDPTRQLKYSRDLARGSSEGLDKLKTAWDDITGGQAADGIADGLSALTGLALNAGEATLRNPVAFTQLAIEQLPQLALASTSMGIYTVSNVGAGLELYHDGVMNFQNDNDGALPSVEQKEHMLTNAFAYAAATQLGDIALLKSFLPKGKKVAEGAVKTGVGRSAGNIGKAAVQGTGIETVQEGYQTYAEGEATNRPATAGQIYEGAAMGGAVGGGISAVGRATNEFKGNTEDQARNRNVEAREEASRKALGEEAYQTGDVSRLLDPKKRKEYSPAIAMGALQRRAVDEGLSPEARKKSADEASKLVTDMQARAEEVKLSNGLFAPENASILKKRVADLEKQKTELAADDAQGIESVENEIASAKDVIKQIGKMSTKERRAMEQETQEAVDAAAKVSEMYNAMDVASSAAETAQDDVGMDVRVTEANSDAGTAEGRKSTDIVIRSAMKNPNAITSDDALALAENTKNSLTDTERTYMRRYSEAQAKANLEKGPKGVQAEIFTGGKGFVGLSQYRAFVNKAINDKDSTTANTQLRNLKAFAKQHAGKKAAVESALEDSSKSGKAINLYYTKEGGWRRTDKKISKTERDANAGLTIAGNSKNLVDSIAYEAEAIQAVSNELEAAYEVSKQAPNEATASDATPTVSPESEPTDTNTEAVPADVNATTQQGNTEVLPTNEAANDTNQDTASTDAVAGAQEKTEITPDTDGAAPATESTPATDESADTANTEQEAAPAPKAKQETGKLDPKKSRNINANGLREVMRSAREIAKDFKDTDPLDENIQFEKAAELKATKETLDTALTEISKGNNAQVAKKAREILKRTKDKELTEKELAAAAVEMGKFMRQVELSTEDMFNQAETTTTSDGVDYTIDPETGEIIESNPTEKVEKPTNIKSGMGRLKALTAAVQEITGPLGHDQYWSLLRSEGLGGFLKQKFGGKRRVTTQPLTNVEDFMSELRQDIKLANEFLPEDMTAQQENLIREFLDLAQGWNQDIVDALPDMKNKNPAFMYEDYMYFLRDRETGETEQNLLSAVSVAVFAHLLESGTFTPYNNREDINAILGREAEHPISNKEFEDLGDIGVRDALLINRLGQRAAQALGMDTVAGANLNVSSKVVTALGTQALGLMTNAGLIETTIVTETEFREMQGDTSLNVNSNASPKVQKEQQKARSAADKIKNYFIKLNTEDAGNKKLLESVNKTYQGTGSVFADLFSVTDTKVSPTWKPTKYNQKTINNTNRGVPKELAKLMAGESVKAHLVRQDGNSLMRSMSKNAYLAIGGRVSTETRWVHQSNDKTYQGKNDGLEREYDDWIEFTDAGMARNGTLDTPFYMDRFIAKPQRAFIKGAINPQGNKLQRGLVSMVGWNTKVDMSKPDSLEMESFWLGVGEAMGLKTDAEYNDQSVLDAQAIAQEPVVQKAVVAIMKGFNNETLKDAENEAIVAAANRGGEGYHSLDGLTALAHMEAAKKKEETTFEHSLTREVDGKTNGPMFAIAMLAAAGNSQELIDKLIAGGFFSEASGYEQVNAWAKNPKNHDLYKQVAGKMAAKASEATNGNQEKADIFNAIYSFTGQLSKADGSVTSEGRKLVKQPITALMFGSGFETIAGHMQEDFLQSIYDKIETIANDSTLDDADKQAALEEVWVNTNKIIGKQNSGLHIVQGTTLEQAKGRMNKETEKVVKQGFASSFGEVLSDTMDVEFGTFIETRNALNEGANVAFKLYDMAYAHEKRVLLKSLVDSKNAPYVKRGKTEVEPVLDLTPEQDQAIKDKLKLLLPVMHSAASRQEGDAGLDNGIFLAKSSKRLSSDEAYRTQTNFKKNLEGRASKTITVYGWELSMTDPGVAAMILGIHSMDSLIAARTYSKFQALNVHDAAFGKTTLMRKIAKEFNKNTLDVLSEYSVPNEISNALERTLVAFQELTVGLDPNSELAQAYAELEGKTRRRHKRDWNLEKDSPVDAIGYLLGSVKTKAWEGDKRKLEAFEMMAFLDQYSMQEGNHKLTLADKERLAELKTGLQSELDPKSKEAALTLKGQFAEASKIQTKAFFNPGAKVEPETSSRKRDAGNKVKLNQSSQPQTSAVDKNLNNEQAKKEPMNVFDNVRSQTNKPITEEDAKTAEDLINKLHAMKRQNKTAKDVVAAISKNVPNAYRPLMRRLANHSIVNTIPIRILDHDSPYMGTAVYSLDRDTGDYVVGSEEIRLNTKSFEKVLSGEIQFAENTATKTIAETVIHELLHGALNHVLSNSKSADAVQLKKRIEAVQGDIAAWVQNNPKEVAKLSSDTMLGLREIRDSATEVLTYGLTASRVQAVMKVIPSSNKKSTAWSEFVTAIRGFLGMENTQQSVLDEILSIADAAFEVAPPGTQQNGDTVQEQDAMVAPDPTDQIAGYTVDEIFKGLENAQDVLPMAEKDNLTGLLDSIVERLHGPYGAFHDAIQATQPLSPEEVFYTAKANGETPFSSATLNAGFTLNDQQAFVLEQVEATVAAGIDNDPAIYREMNKVWKEASQELEGKITDDQWAHLFDIDGLDALNRSPHLSQFAAVALVDPEIRNLMGFNTYKDTRSLGDMKLGERLATIFQRILQALNGRLTKSYSGQQADQKVRSLVEQLISIESKAKRNLAHREATMLERAGDYVGNAATDLGTQIGKAGRSKMIQGSKVPFIKPLGSLTAVVAENRVDEFLNDLQDLRDQTMKKREGFLAAMMTEMRGAKDAVSKQGHALLRYAKTNEHERMAVVENTRKNVLDSFRKDSKGKSLLSKKDKVALNRAYLHTGAADLLTDFTAQEIGEFVTDPAKRKQAIVDYEARLASVESALNPYRTAQAKSLAYHMVTGNVSSYNLMLNAGNIARMYGTKYASQVSETDAQAIEAVLDPLISLYAMNYTNTEDLNLAKQVTLDEADRGNESGIEFMLKLSKGLKAQSKELNFDGSDVLMQKGYTAEILNHNKQVKVADVREGADLVARGWKKVSVLPKDKGDGTKEQRALYIINDGGMTRRLSGNFSLTAEKPRGFELHNGTSRRGTTEADQLQKRANYVVDKEVEKLLTNGLSFDPTKQNESKMAPVLDGNGNKVNYRYVMSEANKDNYLDRHNSFEDILGAIASSTFDKVSTKDQNRQAVQALKDQFDSEYKQKPDSYLRVALDSNDAGLREAFALMPDDTKKAIKEIWGEDAMFVRTDLVDVNFGYRKMSMASAFEKDAGERAAITEFFVHAVENIPVYRDGKVQPLGKRAALRIRQAEDVWQQAVKEIKDIIVVKNVVTLLGNIASNATLLLWLGVSPSNLARDHREALDAVLSYRKESAELGRLKQQQAIGTANNRQRIKELEDSLSRNKAKKLIDAGLLPTIVEDIDMTDDPFSYKSRITEKTEKWVSKVPGPIRTAGRWAYMTHDTPAYKVLSQTTQLSDFVARYTTYKHLTTRKNKQMSESDAIQTASDMFINYDLPTHRGLQYANDMGLVFFTKYFLRIQKTLMQMYQDQPARAIALITFNIMLGGLPTIMDAAITQRMYNPLQWGAFEMGGALGELPAVKLGLSPFN